jgi:hypothetical protein
MPFHDSPPLTFHRGQLPIRNVDFGAHHWPEPKSRGNVPNLVEGLGWRICMLSGFELLSNRALWILEDAARAEMDLGVDELAGDEARSKKGQPSLSLC